MIKQALEKVVEEAGKEHVKEDVVIEPQAHTLCSVPAHVKQVCNKKNILRFKHCTEKL